MEQNENYKNYIPQVEPYTIPRVIGIKQAATEFSIPENAIRRWIKTGELPAISCGRRFLVNCTVLSEFLNGKPQGKPEPPAQPVAVDEQGQLYAALGERKKRSGSISRIKPIY
ncbi:MAG: helix-turn-helix domain-containing protein [Acutalibacteraceae bacterium]